MLNYKTIQKPVNWVEKKKNRNTEVNYKHAISKYNFLDVAFSC